MQPLSPTAGQTPKPNCHGLVSCFMWAHVTQTNRKVCSMCTIYNVWEIIMYICVCIIHLCNYPCNLTVQSAKSIPKLFWRRHMTLVFTPHFYHFLSPCSVGLSFPPVPTGPQRSPAHLAFELQQTLYFLPTHWTAITLEPVAEVSTTQSRLFWSAMGSSTPK